MKYSVIKEWIVSINSLFLLFVLIFIQLNSSIPTYIDSSLTVTVANTSKIIYSDCEIVNYLLKLNIEKEFIIWWLMLNIDTNFDNNYKPLIW
ncbi:MAG: hypothetical protein HXX81_03185, partial [Campylobacterales bacterium]|nr:hypothetical protein [Campylobacterales bacterium]